HHLVGEPLLALRQVALQELGRRGFQLGDEGAMLFWCGHDAEPTYWSVGISRGAIRISEPTAHQPSSDERAQVEQLLGRPPRGGFEVVVRHADGSPLVIRNAPLLDDGTPMPTRYWLVGEPERTRVSRLESEGGVDEAEAEVDPT